MKLAHIGLGWVCCLNHRQCRFETLKCVIVAHDVGFGYICFSRVNAHANDIYIYMGHIHVLATKREFLHMSASPSIQYK